ncbi:hypothetical protein GCM10010345_00440 [Streptomyces canarius]|uniref:Uncharacterized protein n=1 Tax=Streptomyces canarius TaxID=285453 RepID=A0ABQ3CC05_9ACTN|nr:hypothetical protein GCM10010345_00440 [Streptomyces canarius]
MPARPVIVPVAACAGEAANSPVDRVRAATASAAEADAGKDLALGMVGAPFRGVGWSPGETRGTDHFRQGMK